MHNVIEIVKIDPDTDEVVCDGGDAVFGHPRVWYSLDGQSAVQCTYCDRIFKKTQEEPRAAH